jgi:multidrug efflux pump subunit AcrA (membrane-fusion protein)
MSQTTTVEKVRERVLLLAREIESLSRSEAPPEEFFPQFLDRLVRALGADAGVIWMLEEGQRLGLKAEIGLDATGFRENPNAAQQNHSLLVDAMATGQAAVYVPGESEKPLPTQHQIVVAALQTGSESAGVVQIFQRAGAPKEARPGYLQFVEQMCGYASRYLERQKKRIEAPPGTGAASPFLLEFGDFVLQMQRTLEVKEVSSTAASDGRLLLNCDRVSVVLRKGRKTYVQAISGQDSVNKRANLVRKMVDLADAAIAMKEPIIYSGKNDPLPPQIETPLADFLQESKSRLVLVAPLFETDLLIKSNDEDEDPARSRAAKKSDWVIGCLVIEQFQSSEPAPHLEERVDLITDHVAAALHNAREHERIYFLGVLKFFGRISEWFHGRKLLKTLAVLGVLTIVILAMVFIPWDYRVEGEGRLMPVDQRQIYAQVDGEVIKVHAEGGTRVKKGQLLLDLKNDELQAQLTAAESGLIEKQEHQRVLEARISATRSAEAREERLQFQGQLAETKIEIIGLEEQVAIYKERQRHLKVYAPIDGVLATFQVEQKLLNRPIRRGDNLLEVMDDEGEWRLELEVEEHRLGHIFEGQKKLDTENLPVQYVLATRPEDTYTGRVQTIATRADVAAEKGSVVEILTKIEAHDLPTDRRRIGADVRAKINCGKSSLGYVLFGDVIEFVQKHWWRWL